jgi:hypothetical protein
VNAGVERNIDREGTFVEGLEETRASGRAHGTGAEHRQRRDAEQQSPVGESEPERRMVRRT